MEGIPAYRMTFSPCTYWGEKSCSSQAAIRWQACCSMAVPVFPTFQLGTEDTGQMGPLEQLHHAHTPCGISYTAPAGPAVIAQECGQACLSAKAPPSGNTPPVQTHPDYWPGCLCARGVQTPGSSEMGVHWARFPSVPLLCSPLAVERGKYGQAVGTRCVHLDTPIYSMGEWPLYWAKVPIWLHPQFYNTGGLQLAPRHIDHIIESYLLAVLVLDSKSSIQGK